jgi:hypothetical protein
MPLSHDQATELTRQLLNSHEEWQQQATLKETEAAIAWASLKDVQTNLLEMQRQLIQQQEMIQALLTNLAAGVKP